MSSVPPALALTCVAVTFALPVQAVGCTQTAHFALVRALERGTPRIDRYHWQTCDKSWVDGHFYAAKGPGLALLSLPVFALLNSVGLGWDEPSSRSDYTAYLDVPRSAIWPFTLWGAGVAALLLLLLTRWTVERVVPGYGTATAVALGLSTLVLPYATLYASHVAAAALAFAAFAILWRERESSERLPRLLAAGGLAGLAVVFDYPILIVAGALAAYAAMGARPARRALVYATGAVAGLLPLLAYNRWAFGDISRQPYEAAVIDQGQSGHDVIGANASGFFGIGVPRPEVVVELLFSRKGLLTTTPVVAVGAAGLVLLYRAGHRVEAVLGGGVAVAYLVYNSAYYLPFGGDTAGPRLLIPILPFLALGLALTLRCFPLTTAALGLVSAATMVIATATEPMLGALDTRTWGRRFIDGDFSETALSLVGAGDGWLAVLPLFIAFGAALVLAVMSLPRREAHSHDREMMVTAIVSWAALASGGPVLLTTNLSETAAACAAVGIATAVGLATWYTARRAAGGGPSARALNLEEREPSRS